MTRRALSAGAGAAKRLGPALLALAFLLSTPAAPQDKPAPQQTPQESPAPPPLPLEEPKPNLPKPPQVRSRKGFAIRITNPVRDDFRFGRSDIDAEVTAADPSMVEKVEFY